MKWTSMIIFSFLSIFLVLSGCQDKEIFSLKQADEPPEMMHKNLLYYKQESSDNNTGDLYLKKFEEKTDKVAGDVRNYSFTYSPELDRVFFITYDETLYEYEQGKAKEKLADEVTYYELGNTEIPILYYNEASDLYIIKEDDESEKIGSEVTQTDLISHDIYYLNQDGDLNVYNTESRVEEQLAIDVSQFALVNESGDFVYVDSDYFLHYRDREEEEGIRISPDSIWGLDLVYVANEQISYVDDEDNLYMTGITADHSPDKIASDVMEFEYEADDLYFLNTDNNLFKRVTKEEDPVKVASDVYDFAVHKSDVYYLNNENALYQSDQDSNQEKIASSIVDYAISPNGDVVYDTSDDALFINDEKVTSDLNAYSYANGHLVYSTNEDKIMVMENLKESEKLDEDTDNYSGAYYGELLIYMNRLEFSDVAGVWETGYDNEYIEFSKDGTMTLLPSGDSIKLKQEEDGNSDTLHTHTENDDYVRITKENDNELIVNFNEEEFYLTKVSKEEAEKEMAHIQEEMAHEAIYYLFDNYIGNFANAVNDGNSDYVTSYIAASSDLYGMQKEYIKEAYADNVQQALIDYHIEDIQSVGDGKYKVTVAEQFMFYADDNYEGEERTYRNNYIVEKIDDKYLITDLDVSTE